MAEGPREHFIAVGWHLARAGQLAGYAATCTCGWHWGPEVTMGKTEEAANRHLRRLGGWRRPTR